MIDLNTLSDKEIFSLTIIGEARGEPIEGQVAVASVIRNRLHYNALKYKDYSSVCLEKEQFSCWNKNDSNFSYLTDLANKMLNAQSLNDPFLRQCILVANGIMNWDIIDNTGGSRFYLAKSLKVQPSWSVNRTNVKVIGNQTFFNV